MLRHAGAGENNLMPSCRTAVILAGGVRDFDMGGPSTVQHLLRPLNPADVCVFLRAPLDPDTHKISLLADAGATVASVHLGDTKIPHCVVSRDARGRLTTRTAFALARQSGLAGHQALRVMAYVRQIEQAQDAVSRFEQRRGRNLTLEPPPPPPPSDSSAPHLLHSPASRIPQVARSASSSACDSQAATSPSSSALASTRGAAIESESMMRDRTPCRAHLDLTPS